MKNVLSFLSFRVCSFLFLCLFSLINIHGNAQATELRVRVENAQKTDQLGEMLVSVFDEKAAANFPKGNPIERQKAVPSVLAESKDKTFVEFTFNLPAGRYALAAFHDLNNNQKLDRSMIGMPTEPYGFSRDARGKFGPPSFDSAVIVLEDKPMQLIIKLN